MQNLNFKIYDKDNDKIYPSEYKLIKEIHFDINGNPEKIIIAEFLPNGNWNFEEIKNFEILKLV